jgi:hypothetical protein
MDSYASYQGRLEIPILAPIKIIKSVTAFSWVRNGRLSYPVGSQLDRIRFALGILAKLGVSHTATEGIPILDDHKIVNGRVGQSLLQIACQCRVLACLCWTRGVVLLPLRHQPFHLP